MYLAFVMLGIGTGGIVATSTILSGHPASMVLLSYTVTGTLVMLLSFLFFPVWTGDKTDLS